MNKKIVLATIAAVLMVTMLFPIVTAPIGSHPNITLVSVSIGEPETVDPGWCYDTASATIIMNVYDTLVWFNRTSMTEFIPSLATDWYFNETGMYWNFTIRQTFTNSSGTFPVIFHNGATLTPSDVEYSFERWMVLDHAGGPTWMIFEPLLGCDYWDTEDPGFAAKVDASVESDANNVYFYYQAGAFPQLIFLQTIAQSWASILDEDWAKAQGCWDGNWSNTATYYDPTVSPIDAAGSKMCGTGPYELDYWTHGIEWSVIKNDAYWGPWPADASTGQACDDYVDRYVARKVDEWSTRKLEFVGGDADLCYVPRMYMHQLMSSWDPTEVYLPGIECTPHLATLQADGIFFNFNISNGQFKYPVSPYLSGLDYGELDPKGICPDFFSDIHVRKAFAYSINYSEYIEAAFMGEATYPSTPSIFGLPYRRPPAWYDANAYQFNLTKAEEEWKLAWDGNLWATGFKLTITYNTGNVPRKTMADMLEANVESMVGQGATSFVIETLAIDWGSTYIPQLFTRQLPLFIIGWLADYPDPHNFFQPFMGERGAFSGVATQGYNNTEVNALLDEEIASTNATRRQEIFYRLQEIYIEDVPSICVDQPEGRHWNRDWVKGWYPNKIYPGTYIYHTWIARVGEPKDVEVSVVDIDIGSTNITEHLISQSYHAPQTGIPWVKENLVTGASIPIVHVNGTIQRFDTTGPSYIGIYVVWFVETESGHIHELHFQYWPSLGTPGSGFDVIPFGPANLSDVHPDPGNYTLNVYALVTSGFATNVHLTPNFEDGWFVVAGLGMVNEKDWEGKVDWIVDGQDYQKVKRAIYATPGSTEPDWLWMADVNEDGLVDGADWTKVKSKIGTIYAPA